MSKDFSYLRTWLQNGHRPVLLECVPSRSSLSMTVYDRGERLFTVQGYGYDRIGTALAHFLAQQFYPELLAFARTAKRQFYSLEGFSGFYYRPSPDGHGGEGVSLDGACGFSSMQSVADAIGLSAQLSETKAGTLIIIQKKG